MDPNNKYLIPTAIVIAALIIGGFVYMRGRIPSDNNGGATEEIVVAPVTEKDHILGNPNAEILIVEFSDTECPFCKTFHETMHRLVDEYGKDGKVAWVYRHFPIVQLHSRAPKEAEATECANEIGGNTAFWSYLDAIMEATPSNNGLDPARLPELAAEVGLDRAKFEQCLNGGKYAQQIQKSVEAAFDAGAQGTPYSIIITKDGQKFPVNGAQPYETVKQVIETILAETPDA